MFDADGTFNEGHMNNWQHAAMYFAYMISGFVDIVGFYTELPPDSEQVMLISDHLLNKYTLKSAECPARAPQAALGLAFVTEGLLLAEICCKGSVLLTLARALLVLLQGIWFIQIGYILFKGACDLPSQSAARHA